MKPLRKLDIFSYGIGDFGINLHFQMINFFFAYFLTDIFGIPLFHVMILLLVSRVIDAITCLLYTSPSPRDYAASRMPSSA